MFKLAIAILMTISASAIAMAPVPWAVSEVFALFVVMGSCVVTVATVGALKTISL